MSNKFSVRLNMPFERNNCPNLELWENTRMDYNQLNFHKYLRLHYAIQLISRLCIINPYYIVHWTRVLNLYHALCCLKKWTLPQNSDRNFMIFNYHNGISQNTEILKAYHYNLVSLEPYCSYSSHISEENHVISEILSCVKIYVFFLKTIGNAFNTFILCICTTMYKKFLNPRYNKT